MKSTRIDEVPVNDYVLNNEQQRVIRDRILKPWYRKMKPESNIVFLDDTPLMEDIQQAFGIDVIIQDLDKPPVAIEEKIANWKGVVYDALTLETWSCSIEGYEKRGWMYTSRCDYLFYGHIQENERSILLYMIPFKPLQEWFFDQDRYMKYYESTQPDKNKSKTRVTKVYDIFKGVEGCHRLLIEEDNGEVYSYER